MMTIAELIRDLQKFTDQNAGVEVAVKTHTQVHPQAYAVPYAVSQSDGGARLYITLPEGFYIGERKVR